MSAPLNFFINGRRATVIFPESEYLICGRHTYIHRATLRFDDNLATYNDPSQLAVKVARCVPNHDDYTNRVSVMFRYNLRNTWSSLNHHRIAPFIGILTMTNGLPAVAVPYYREGNIREYNRRHPLANRLKQLLHVAEGVNYLHQMKVWHGALYSNNIMMEENADGVGVRITDPLFSSLMYALDNPIHQPVPAAWHHKSVMELEGHPIDDKTDVYQFGGLMYEVLTGVKPFHDVRYTSGVVKIMRHGHRALPQPSCIDDQVWVIMQDCWTLTPVHRPSMAVIEAKLHALL